MPVIEIQDLTKHYDTVLAVDHLSFAVERGSAVGFLGPNGAGKTTTLRTLVGLVDASAGRATINGRLYRELADPLHQVGAMLEASSFYPGRSARDHLRVQALAGGVAPARVDEVLALVSLTDVAERRVGGYSLGMRQRLGIAAALLGDPGVLILDEPANGLDPEGVRWLRELLRRLAAEGRTVLVSSHVLAEVAQTVDSVVIIDRGRLVTQSPLETLIARAQVVRIRTPQAQRLADAVARDGVTVKHMSGDQLEITGATSASVGTLAAELRIPILESTTEVANLEDVFFRLTAAHAREGVSQ